VDEERSEVFDGGDDGDYDDDGPEDDGALADSDGGELDCAGRQRGEG